MEYSIYHYEKTYPAGCLKNYEVELIQENICSAFLPAGFLSEEGCLRVIYQYDGYRRISQCRFREVYQVLNLLERVILRFYEAYDFFIGFNRVDFTCDSVFYSGERDEVRLAFEVSEDEKSFPERMACFIEEIRGCIGADSHGLLDQLVSYLHEENRTAEEILKKIREMKRQVYLKGVK